CRPAPAARFPAGLPRPPVMAAQRRATQRADPLYRSTSRAEYSPMPRPPGLHDAGRCEYRQVVDRGEAKAHRQSGHGPFLAYMAARSNPQPAATRSATHLQRKVLAPADAVIGRIPPPYFILGAIIL